MPGDLHNHTTYSDGSVPVARLPLMAARVGLDTMAISDHDTLRSVQYAYDHPVQDGVRLIPAAELTGYDFERSHRVHLLTFWPDLDCPALRRHCDIMRQSRNECALQSCREIEALYPQFRTEQALEYARDSGVLYKSGIMQALQQLGLCDGIYTGLYHELFGWEPRGKCLHSPTYPPVREVLATAKAAGAVVVFAHPTVYKSMPLLRELVREGMVDGIEIDHPSNSPEDKAECTSSSPAAATSTARTTASPTRWVPASPRTTRSRASRRWPASAGAALCDRATLTSSSDKDIIKILRESARLSVGYKERKFEYEQVFQLPQQGYLLQGDPHRAER